MIEMPRGYRDHNPCNIRPGSSWLGMTGVDTSGGAPGYCVFGRPEHGIRAGCRILITYNARYGLKTPLALISRWAPPSDDNPTEAYAANIAKALGIAPTAEFNFYAETAKPFMDAIIRQELGNPAHFGLAEWYSDDLIHDGIDMAFGVGS